MKKLTITTILLTTLFLTGCFALPQKPSNNVILNPDPDLSGRDEESQEIDTSNWKTYRNEEYGFEFKYPGDFHIFVNADSGKTWERQLRDIQQWTDKSLLALVEVKNVAKDKYIYCSSGGPGGLVEGLSIKFVLTTNSNETFDLLEDECAKNSEIGYCITKMEIVNSENVLIIESGMSGCAEYPTAKFIKNNLQYSLSSLWWTTDVAKRGYYKDLFYNVLETVKID